jgi:uncharacterized protein YyaL (SSP411 family)
MDPNQNTSLSPLFSTFQTMASTPGLVAADAFHYGSPSGSHEEHIRAAVDWLKLAQDVTDDRGFSYGYCLRGPNLKAIAKVGWRPSYVETTGYIIETFYECARRFDDQDLAERATQAAHWLKSIQNEDGSFSNAQYGQSRGIVFDTGQDLFGLTRAYIETGDTSFLQCAGRAAYWLANTMDSDGCWRKNTHLGHVHTYNTRSAWAMLEYASAANDSEIREAACRNLDWSLTQQKNGFFENCAFRPGLPPFTHTIAYAIRGILEGALKTGNGRYLAAATESALKVSEYVDERGFIPVRIAVDGTTSRKSCCLTGNCQLAIIWYKLAEISGNNHLIAVANRAVEYVMRVQDIKTKNRNIRGAIKGSHPIWGKYTPLVYPNWAAKFFIDSMLLREKHRC